MPLGGSSVKEMAPTSYFALFMNFNLVLVRIW